MALINLAPTINADNKREQAVSVDGEVDKSAIEALLSDVGETALLRLIGIFAEECDRNCSEIGRFLSQEDFAGGEIVAHRFKSTARQFGANSLAEICQNLEQACAGAQAGDAGELFEALTRVTPRVLANLDDAKASLLKSG